MRGYLASRADSLTAMKAVGGTRAQVMAAALLQILALAGLGSLLGLAAGTATANAAALFLSRHLDVPVAPGLYSGPLVSGLALANIARRGSGLTAVVFSLGLGLAVLATVVLTDLNLRDQLDRQMPAAAPSYFFMDIPKDGLAHFQQTVLAVPGVQREEHALSIRGRVVLVNGVPAEQVRPDPDAAWILRGDRGLTTASRPPEGTRLSAGAWWPEGYQGPPLVSFDERAAKGLGLKLGDSITVNVLGREITARIASLREIEWTSLALNHAMVFSTGVLEATPHTYLATVYADRAAEEALFRAVSQALPEVTSVYVRDVLEGVRRLAGHIGLAVRLASAVTLLAGLLVLSQALRANLQARLYDAVIFKVFGATQRDVLLSLAAEFCLLALATALASAAIGGLAARVFSAKLFQDHGSLHPAALSACVLAGVAVTLGLGFLGVRRALSQKALPVLRNE